MKRVKRPRRPHTARGAADLQAAATPAATVNPVAIDPRLCGVDERDVLRLDIAKLALPVLVERLGGEVSITEDEAEAVCGDTAAGRSA